jgi:hypothetical protein
MSLVEAFTRHPATVGESYRQHLAFAAGIGGRLVVAGIACLVHALLPFLFERTGSRAIIDLHDQLAGGARMRLHPIVADGSSAALPR